MPLPLCGCAFRFVTSLIGCSLIVCSTVYADPLLEPFEYQYDTSEPEMSAAMPYSADPVQRIMQSVVTVQAKVREGARTEATFGTDRLASGVVLDTSGLIATAGYIVAEAETVTVTFANGISDTADIVAKSSKNR